MFIFLIMLIAAAMASEGIVSERARETWDSLIATPLTAREILRSKMLAAIWRMRLLLAILARPLCDRTLCRSHSSRRLAGVCALGGRLDLAHGGIWDLYFDRSERRSGDDRADDGACLRNGWFGRSAVPAAGPIKLGLSRRRLAALRRVSGTRILSRRSQCLAVSGLSFFGVDALRPPKGRSPWPQRA